MSRKFLLACLLATLVSACNNSDNGLDVPSKYSAEIRRTDYGIPHIKADDWAGLGYGFGYAYAQDNFCVTMREVVFATGRSAELMGEDEGRRRIRSPVPLSQWRQGEFQEEVCR